MSEPAPAPRPEPEQIDPLRAEMERLDKAMLDLVAQRLRLGDRMKSLIGNEFPLRPGPEAAMLRNLIAAAPEVEPDLIVELWRTLIAANVRRHTPLDIAVAGGTDPVILFDIARRHFGARTRIRKSAEPQTALLKAIELQNTVAVVPWPAAPGVGSWWPALSESRFHALYLVAGLPVRGAGSEDPQACVFAKTLPEPGGDDITMMIVFDPHHRAQRAMNEVGFKGREVARSEPRALLRVEGFIAHDDPRAGALTRYGIDSVRVLGSFAR
ncbi:MAG: hypothetical protein ABUS57_12380, partial [Pseudomonadota bacterium]